MALPVHPIKPGLRELFLDLVDKSGPREREACLRQACGADKALRETLENLLRHHREDDEFLTKPAVWFTPMMGPVADSIGTRIGPYTLVTKLGEGGFGTVYLADQEQPVRRKVALKVIKIGMDTEQVMARFAAERQALALMGHPNIAKVLDAGATEAGRPYFVMELVSGPKVTDFCDQERLRIDQRLELFIPICQAVQHAHQKGIVHRDLKPSNVLVSVHDGVPVPKVIDFGIAKATAGEGLSTSTLVTAFAQLIGTPAYMSPEAANLVPADIDTRSDIYSLGVLLYELLTGKMPFEAQPLLAALDEWRRMIRETEPLRPSRRLAGNELETAAARRKLNGAKLRAALSGDLDWIVLKALEKDRARRYQTAGALAADISRYLHHEPVAASPPSRVYRIRKFIRRNKLSTTAALAVFASMLIGFVVSTRQYLAAKRAYSQAAMAEAEQRRLRSQSELSRAVLGVQRAEDFFDAGDSRRALAYLARVLRNAPRFTVAAERLLSAFTYRDFLLPAGPPIHPETLNCAHVLARLSPDGRKLAVAGGATARLWDAWTGEPLTPAFRHEVLPERRLVDVPLPARGINSLEFSPDGQRVLTAGGDRTARIWDAQTGLLLARLEYESWLVEAHFSSSSRQILTLSGNHVAQLWNPITGQALGRPMALDSERPQARFSPDGDHLISTFKNTAQIRESGTGELAGPPLEHSSSVTVAKFSPDSLLAVTAAADGTAVVWDARTLERVAVVKEWAAISNAEFSPDSELLATVSGNRVHLWRARSGKLASEALLHEKDINSLEFSQDGLQILTASEDKGARLWDVLTGRLSGEPMRHSLEVSLAHFTPDGRRIVTLSGGYAQLWDRRSLHSLGPPAPQDRGDGPVPVTPNGERLAAISGKATQLWMYRPGAQPPHCVELGAVLCYAFRSDGKLLAISGKGAPNSVVLHALDGRTFQPVAASVPLGTGAAYWARFSPDQTQVVTAGGPDARARVWQASSGRLMATLQHDAVISMANFSSDGRRIVTASDDSTARVWDAITGKAMTPPLRHRGPVTCARFSPDGRWVLTTSADATARLWDAQTGDPMLEPLHQGDELLPGSRFSPDGKCFVTSCRDGTARIWNSETGRPVGKILRHEGPVFGAYFSSDGTRIMTVSGDCTVRLWSAATGDPLIEPLRQTVPGGAEFSPDARRLVTVSGGRVRVWDAATGLPSSEALQVGGEHFWAAEFTPSGDEIVARSERGMWLWPVPEVVTPVPNWVPELAEAIAGRRYSEKGVPETVEFTQLCTLQQRLAHTTGADVWSQWARWFFAGLATRTPAPFFLTTKDQTWDNPP